MSPIVITDNPEIFGQMRNEAIPDPEITTERVSKNQDGLTLRSLHYVVLKDTASL
jgi:hypothetical protein